MNAADARERLAAHPAAFLMTLAFINWLSFAGWAALLHNFTIEQARFGWFETGLTQTVREIPGFLAFTAIFWFMWFREQTVAYVSLAMLALGIALTGYLPTLTGILITTFVMSVGFHYFETVNQSLQLQLLPKAEAPRIMGRIASAGAAGQFLAYGGIAFLWWLGANSYVGLYAGIGVLCILLVAASWALFPKYDGPVPQRKSIILRQRYWLYYALQFMTGARRQIFMAFAGFLLVKKFGYSVADMAFLMLVTALATTMLAPRLGALIGRIGERRTMILENVALIGVFAGYATTGSARIAAALFILDGVIFTLVIAQKTYFQKIGDPADMASTAAVAFTINHIAAVIIPVLFGLLGMRTPSLIFWLGAGIALCSLLLALLVPDDPRAGNETVLAGAGQVVPAE